MTSTVTAALWCGLAALASAVATMLLKFSGQYGTDLNTARLVYLGGAGITYALGFLGYSIALKTLDMSIAYPIMTGIAMVCVAVLGITVFNEPFTAQKMVGMLLVVAGSFALMR